MYNAVPPDPFDIFKSVIKSFTCLCFICVNCQQFSLSTAQKVMMILLCYYDSKMLFKCRSQWPRGLRRRSAAARRLRSWVRIPPRTWMFACCECCVLSGRGLCDELITRSEEPYRLWCVVVCDLETSRIRRP